MLRGALTYTEPLWRLFWHPVARADELNCGAPVSVRLLNLSFVIVRLGSRTAAFYDRCSHRGMPLSAGKIVGDRLRCHYHGFCFDGDGTCVEIPGLRQCEIPSGAGVKSPYGVEVAYGLVWIAIEKPLQPLPSFANWNAPGLHCAVAGPMRWSADAGTILDNFLDVTHFGTVHKLTFGAGEIPPTQIALKGNCVDFEFQCEHLGRKVTAIATDSLATTERHRRRLTYRYTAPFSVNLKIEYLGTSLVDELFLVVQPETSTESRVYKFILNSAAVDSAERAREIEIQKLVNAEDKDAVERVGPFGFSLDLAAQVHTRLDGPTVALRQSLKHLLESYNREHNHDVSN
jgi:phenylpropionate dioxygenase-like ring-hydroxylating dioxygenase large terminal subunit